MNRSRGISHIYEDRCEIDARKAIRKCESSLSFVEIVSDQPYQPTINQPANIQTLYVYVDFLIQRIDSLYQKGCIGFFGHPV